jgi:hypothetical protein
MVRVTADGVTTLNCPDCGWVSSPHTDPLDRFRAQMAGVRQETTKKTT